MTCVEGELVLSFHANDSCCHWATSWATSIFRFFRPKKWFYLVTFIGSKFLYPNCEKRQKGFTALIQCSWSLLFWVFKVGRYLFINIFHNFIRTVTVGKSGESGKLLPGKFDHLEGNYDFSHLKKYIRHSWNVLELGNATIFLGNLHFFQPCLQYYDDEFYLFLEVNLSSWKTARALEERRKWTFIIASKNGFLKS